MKEEILVDLGLTRNEAKIYISLLEIGSGTATKIAESSGVHRVNVYDSLKKLKEKNLASQLKDEDKTVFKASPPNFLINILKEKEIQLQQIIPMLELSHQFSKGEVNVQIYEGYDFLRNMFLRFLENKKDIFTLGIPKFVLRQMGAQGMDGKYFQEEIHKRRAKQKQMMYHVYNSDAIERIKFLNTLPYTEAKCLPKEYDQLVMMAMCGEEFNILLFFESKEKPIIISITNQRVVDAFEKYFWLIWEKAKVP